ncbi:MAG: LysM peptidoglycan-binding domain-containing protein, partial [Desulfobacterales bacterium]|nr:LysM peptidoglycan-binding domain-containing protein [Desulfobacterales bacterium]
NEAIDLAPYEVPEMPLASVDRREAADASSNEQPPNEMKIEALSAPKVQTDLDEALELCQISQDFWQQGELENALETLDRAYALILSVDTSDRPKLIQQKEDLRFMISKRILEIYASRNIVLNGNHNAIPVAINRHVQAEINRFTKGGERNSFIDAYKRSGRYRPAIIKALKASGLPPELSWLPLIESSYRVNALSRSRALGLWQFIPSTGYKFGLSRDKFIDERMDPAKSTKAAINYLKELHRLFGDWSTVLAAYNCGEGRVLRVIRSQNINYLDDFWDLYQKLPRETARYVPRFLATLHIIKNPETYGLDRIPVEPPLEYETVSINKQVHLKKVANSIGVDMKVLRELNPELRYRILPGDNYQLRIPPGNRELLMAKIDQIPISHPPQRAFVYHRVRHGETLSIIARKYRTGVKSIMRANNLRRSNFIVAGKLLKIPRRGYAKQTPRIPQKPKNGQTVTHVVRKGDSLYIIAKQYGTTTSKIQKLNNLSSTLLHKGQVLTIFAGASDPPAVDGLATYEVQQGDSPFQIAKRYKMALDRFMHLNQLYPGSTIFPGQKLYVE